MIKRVLAAIGMTAMAGTSAHPLCIYRGKENAKTTIEREYEDSRWVVRAHVVSADYHWSDREDSWTLYTLRIVQTYKGKIAQRFAVFTERDSGGFYMDVGGGAPDMERDYLLFLSPLPLTGAHPPGAKQAVQINYSCGQSKPWSEVEPGQIARLLALSAR